MHILRLGPIAMLPIAPGGYGPFSGPYTFGEAPVAPPRPPPALAALEARITAVEARLP